jgi:hypothetical protein
VILPPLIATKCLKPANKCSRYTIAALGLFMSVLGVSRAVQDILEGASTGGE